MSDRDYARENAELRQHLEAQDLQIMALKQRVYDLNMELANKDMELIVTRAQIEEQGPTPPLSVVVVEEEEELEA